jgi:hypothetical protein
LKLKADGLSSGFEELYSYCRQSAKLEAGAPTEEENGYLPADEGRL